MGFHSAAETMRPSTLHDKENELFKKASTNLLLFPTQGKSFCLLLWKTLTQHLALYIGMVS